MEISRDFYLDKLIKRKHNGLIKVITGIRIHMYPLSFAEFMNVYNGDKYMGLSEYMLYGVFLWLSFVKVQMIRRLHCRIYSMKSIFGILPGKIV